MKKILASLFAIALLGSATSSFAQSSSWVVDPGHSSVLFSVRHILTPFYGQFTKFNVNLTWDDANPANSSVTASLDPNSVSTGYADRDNHLKSADFFDAASHGEWSFASKSIEKVDGGYLAKGTLTARGKSNEIEVPFQFLGVKDMGKGGKKAGAVAEFTIQRTAFGLGGMDPYGALGDDVKLIVNLELNGK